MTLTFSASTSSMAIANTLKNTQASLQKSMQRLATGFKINSSADGSAAMAIGINMDSQIRGYDVAGSNIQQGISMLATADSALQSMVGHLQNLRDIAIAASNSTTTTSQFSSYQAQVVAEIAAVNNIANNTKYDSNILLDGSIAAGAAFNIQIGANASEVLDIKTAFSDNKAATLTVAQNTLTTTANAATLLGQVNAALDTVNTNLATLGGFQSRLTDQLAYVDIAKTNYTAAQSSIRDTDVAQETANLTRLQILQQAGAYALAQANTSPQTALSLLPH
jgi:flagellin